MKHPISKDLMGKWLTAWCLSREVSLPVKYRSGFKVDVGWENQKARYIFTELNGDFIRLSEEINEPWVFLKVCASPREIKSKISDRWKIQPQGYMMGCKSPMKVRRKPLSEDYKVQFENYNSTAVVRILTQNGGLAAEGRVIVVEDIAVYDRIKTEDQHRRNGLGTFLMAELEQIALSGGISQNFLVATEEGKSLYETLGWELHDLFTSMVLTD